MLKIIDAHAHLWLRQTAGDVVPMPDGRALFFGEERQMVTPFMRDGVNSAETFLANMNYAQVGGAVVVQEVIDGNQDAYLREVQQKFPDRFFCCALKDLDNDDLTSIPDGFKGVAVPGHRASRRLTSPEVVAFFKMLESKGLILSMCLADDADQIAQMREVIQECPHLKIAVGHFGMVTGKHWIKQIELAEYKNVTVEAGGITWLFNDEFYPYPGAVRSVREAADRVGIEKLMWGSDYPRTICAITYRMSYDFFLKSDVLNEEEKAAFLGENAAKFYGFGELPELPYVKNMSE